ncbi:type III-A CRISPR-associated RAMP protein Csm5 [Helicobacter cetorum]|uniref:type III-A CRISPR-associated RAMP protein Csm5 n=1 Tax=Helicobacter cetorum TaxID=138563 RepID=UPI00131588CB|nr:type III-A CRISPR-associated RAMP protein Csm5 [Helicobacter cetorum]
MPNKAHKTIYKYKVSVLSPIHIGSGNSFELNYNIFYKNGFLYLYNEFQIVDFLQEQGFGKIESDVVKTNLIEKISPIRKIKNSFCKIGESPILEHISSQNTSNNISQNILYPYIPGSSIKGSLRTAILNALILNPKTCMDMSNILNKNIKDSIKQDKFVTLKNTNKKNNKKTFYNNEYDKDFVKIFRCLNVSDSMEKLDTKIYKTINLKIGEDKHNPNTEISSYVECIIPNQTFEITIADTSSNFFKKEMFGNLGEICKEFYQSFFDDEKPLLNKVNFDNTIIKDIINKDHKNYLSNQCFLLNVGRFSGAEKKSFNEKYRNIEIYKKKRFYYQEFSTTKNYALESHIENDQIARDMLLPFGWLLFEKIN